MPISSPKLPPKIGYVEVEINGERTYRNAKTGILIDQERGQHAPDVWDQMAAAIQEGVNEV